MRHYALIGDPVAHSLSPLIYSTLFAEYGVAADFSLLRIPEGQVREALLEGLDGFAVTMPHKQAVLPLLARIAPDAAAMGSVNIVKREPEGFCGFSTDGEGLYNALCEAGFPPEGQHIAILGGGGAARSAAHRLAQAGYVTLTGRNPGRIAETARQLGVACAAPGERHLPLAAARILINATPQGMRGHPSFASFDFLDLLPQSALVADMVYDPRETALLCAARARGLAALDGTAMLLHQAYLAFEIWTGIRVEPELMNPLLRRKML